MRNKRFILFSLWLAFSLVLGHNIIPHHHHDSPEEQSVNDTRHHEGDDLLADFFGHFAHSNGASCITFQNASSENSIRGIDSEISPVTVSAGTLLSDPLFTYGGPGYSSGQPFHIHAPSLSDQGPPRAPPAC